MVSTAQRIDANQTWFLTDNLALHSFVNIMKDFITFGQNQR